MKILVTLDLSWKGTARTWLIDFKTAADQIIACILRSLYRCNRAENGDGTENGDGWLSEQTVIARKMETDEDSSGALGEERERERAREGEREKKTKTSAFWARPPSSSENT